MRQHFTPNWLHYSIALVWISNGLFCKVMNLVPRHQEIVARILGDDNAHFLTMLTGVAETGMAVWILSGIQRRLNVVIQILVIATMNTLEFFLAPDLLLWGRANAFFAFLLIGIIYYNEFRHSKKLTGQKACFHF